MQRDVIKIRPQVRAQSGFANGVRTPGTQGTEKRRRMRPDAVPAPQTQDKSLLMFQTLDDEFDNLTLDQFKARFKQLFEASTNTDDTYHKWQNIHQTSGRQPARIMKIAGELADLEGSLPRGSISDYTQRQQFLDAMDSRLRRNVEPQLRPEDTWDQMVAVAERYDATMYRTGGYKE